MFVTNRKGQTMMTTKLETITPVMAKKWLEKMIANRPLSEGKSLEYAISMDEGKWSLNGETIKFDNKDRLFDGQHRLSACVLAEKPFKSYVVRGVEDPMAFATVDVGRARTHADIFDIAGIANANIASNAASWIYMYKNDMLGPNGAKQRRFTKADLSPGILGKVEALPVKGGMAKDVLLKFMHPHKTKLSDAVKFANNQRKGNKIISRGALAGAYFLFSEKSEVAAGKFFRDLLEGTELQADDAVFRLRERLMMNKASKKKLNRYQIFHLTVKAWNKRRAGEKVGHTGLRVMPGEDFYKIA